MDIPFMKWLHVKQPVKRDNCGMPIMNTCTTPYGRLMKIYMEIRK